MQARDGLAYIPQTFLDGVMEKYIPGDREFDVPEKLIELYRNKDFGRYAQPDGRMPGMFYRIQPHFGRKFGFASDRRRRAVDRVEFRPLMGRHDERPELRCFHLPQHFSRYTLRPVPDRQIGGAGYLLVKWIS